MIALVLAAGLFAAGGLFMKVSVGATRPLPTLAFCVLFVAGAMLQAIAMRRADMGVVYIVVLGLEAVAALLISTLYFREPLTTARIAAVTLIVVGIALLRRA